VTDKYLIIKLEDFHDWEADRVRPVSWLLEHAIKDGVVIRRQDLFAGPALHAYAACIALASKMSPDASTRRQLGSVADYFHEQAVLADSEGRKIPD
jgi:hypothetical protein